MVRLLGVACCVLLACGDGDADVDPASSIVSLDRTTEIVANGVDAVTLTVTVRTSDGTAVSGAHVVITAPDDVAVSQVEPTDRTGRTSAVLTSVVAGEKIIGIAVDGVVLDDVVIAFSPGPVASLVFLDQPVGVEIGNYLPAFRVAFADAFDNVIATETGTISLVLAPNSGNVYLLGSAAAVAVDGIASFSMVAVSAPGTGLVLQATAGPLMRDSAAFDVIAGPPATSTSTLTASPSTAVADGIAPIAVAVTLRNSSNIALPGVAVTLAATGAGATLSPASGTTDGQGRFSAVLTSTTPGASTVTATAGSFMLDATVTFVAPPCTPHLPGLPATALGNGAWSLRINDFDGDGHKDAAVLHRTTESDVVSILRGIGNGRFHPPVQYTVGPDTFAFTDGDYDLDGDVDLVVTGSFDDKLYHLSNDGTGTFAAPVSLNLPYNAFDVETVDFNDDGKPDLVVRADYVVMTLAGTGTGTFGTATTYTLDTPQFSDSSVSIEVARLDGNTTDDIFTVGNGRYTVLLGNANGTFTPLTSVDGGEGTDSFAIADLNGDTFTDVVHGASMLYGNGDGTFDSAVVIAPTFGWQGATRAADLDGNGKPDLVASTGIAGVSIQLGTAGGTLQSPDFVALGRGARSLGIADIDEDGELDVVVAQEGAISSLLVLRGTGTGAVIGGARRFGDGVGSFWPAAGDLDGNGTFDFVAENRTTLNRGPVLAAVNGTLTAPPAQPAVQGVEGAFEDFDGDGKLDVLSLYSGLHWYRGNGNGTLQDEVLSTLPTGWKVDLRLADLDGDGDKDAIAVQPIENKVTVAYGSGTGVWANPVQYSVAAEPRAVDIADIDNDGDLDLIVASRNGKAVTVLRNNGAGVFTAGAPLASGFSPYDVAVGDIDGDTYADIIIGDTDRTDVGFYKGDGTGSFASEARIAIGAPTYNVLLYDLDVDGELDVLLPTSGLFFARGATGATFLPFLLYDVGFTRGPVIRDFNADGKPDFMFANNDTAATGFTLAYGAGCVP